LRLQLAVCCFVMHWFRSCIDGLRAHSDWRPALCGACLAVRVAQGAAYDGWAVFAAALLAAVALAVFVLLPTCLIRQYRAGNIEVSGA
jgi:hypothetical protein